MSDDAKPKWYGTRRGARRPNPAAKVRVRKHPPFDPSQREPNGDFKKGWAGGPGAALGPPRVKPSMETQIERARTEIRRTVRQIIASDFPGAMQRSVAILVEIMEDTEQPAAARIAAVRELQNRHDGKPREHKTIKRTGDTNGTTFNVQMFGADGARILEAVQSPEDRYRLAAMIDQMGQLEANTIDVPPVEITSGPEDVIEAEARPGLDVSTDNGISM